jgi:hypothetical protein
MRATVIALALVGLGACCTHDDSDADGGLFGFVSSRETTGSQDAGARTPPEDMMMSDDEMGMMMGGGEMGEGSGSSTPRDAGVTDGDASVSSTAVGASCAAAAECPAGGTGTAQCLTDWPDGYCAVVDCETHGHDCPNDPGLVTTATTGSKCVLAPTAMCLALCGSAKDCRQGYACVEKEDAAGHGSAKVCMPK